MNSNDPSLLDDDAFMMEDPIGYNDAVVGFFREKYAEHIESIFKKLKNNSILIVYTKTHSPFSLPLNL